MAKRPNPTIGTVACQCGETGAVRRDRAGCLYYVCHCGHHPMHGERGQTWINAHADLWTGDAPPDDAPEWIKRGLGHPPGTRSPFSRPRAPRVAPSPPEPEPQEIETKLADHIDDPAPARRGIMGFR
jgi:hypothetical protein